MDKKLKRRIRQEEAYMLHNKGYSFTEVGAQNGTSYTTAWNDINKEAARREFYRFVWNKMLENRNRD